MKKSFLGLMAVVCMLLASSSGYGQKKISKKVKATTVDVSRGANPIIKTEAPDTDVYEPVSRGPKSCNVQFANYTGYYVNVYIDGFYRGQVAPWGGGTVMVAAGYTSIYCITAGKTLEWMDAGNCSGVYTFKLYP